MTAPRLNEQRLNEQSLNEHSLHEQGLDEHREEQLHGGYQPVACGSCETKVLVRRASPEQTTIQWPGSPACPELLDRPAAGTPVLRCAALSRAVRAAADRGELPPARP